MQDKPPIDALNAYLDGFHFYSGNMNGQMEAHHYCANLNEELIQCVIFDGNKKDARLMGVEYIVSACTVRDASGIREDDVAQPCSRSEVRCNSSRQAFPRSPNIHS
jgi:hypothetical protein